MKFKHHIPTAIFNSYCSRKEENKLSLEPVPTTGFIRSNIGLQHSCYLFPIKEIVIDYMLYNPVIGYADTENEQFIFGEWTEEAGKRTYKVLLQYDFKDYE